MKPIVFAALPDKGESTYSSLLKKLAEYGQSNGLTLLPTSILIDFELSAFNTFETFSPNANILFWPFHFAKTIITHLKKLREYFVIENSYCQPSNYCPEYLFINNIKQSRIRNRFHIW